MEKDVKIQQTARGEFLCDCGCGRRWPAILGSLAHSGVTTRFVALPMMHNGIAHSWMALDPSAWPEPRLPGWILLRSWVDQKNLIGSVTSPPDSPIRLLQPFTSGAYGPLLTRDQVQSQPQAKTLIFGIHDAIAAQQRDLRVLWTLDRSSRPNPPASGKGLDFTFGMPDCVFALPVEQRSRQNLQNFAECEDRRFVRALLPIRIEDGGELRIGIWVEISRDDFRRLYEVFWDDEKAYVAMSVSGRIENTFRIIGENLNGILVRMAARTPDECLFVLDSESAWLASLLARPIPTESLPDLKFEIFASARQG
ncbi:MAG: DUF2199 domain-containing protein [Planctomycetota bacterium]